LTQEFKPTAGFGSRAPETSNRSHALSNRSGVGQAAKTWKLQSAWPRPGLETRRIRPFAGVFRTRQTPGDPLTAATRPMIVACKGIDMYDGNAWLTTQHPRTSLGGRIWLKTIVFGAMLFLGVQHSCPVPFVARLNIRLYNALADSEPFEARVREQQNNS
jgi:hypothetical protein